MTTTAHKTRSVIFLAAVLAALTVAAPLAQAQPTDLMSCTQASPYPGWISVIDDQGVPFLYPVGFAPAYGVSCSQAPAPVVGPDPQTAPSPGSATTMSSPYPGWVIVIDDLGLPTLVPSGL